jgi:GNAT superfamily N-acetyltransferase
MREQSMKKTEFHPVTADRWSDLETLFGKNGACAGCWCMWWRIRRSVFDKQKGEANRKALKKLVTSNTVPGILAYVDGKPAGWVCVGPRDDFPVLENSRLFKRIDEEPVWSIVCFFVARPYRRSGMTRRLLDEAGKFARQKGARFLEGYPVEPKKEQMPDLFAYTGFSSAFRKAGFQEVIRRSETRPMMRKKLR